MKNKLFILLSLLGFYSNTYATRYYVNSTATGNGSGLTWNNAFTDLQTALSVVIFGDEVWVASGQYKTTTSTDRTVSFVLRDGVNIYGSFAGTETKLAERNIASNPTTLNGDIGQTGEVNDNTYNIIRGNNITSNIILDGFRISNGNSSDASYRGGAISYTNSLSGNLFINNCYFYSNRAAAYGGAIYIRQSKMTIEDCEFRNNQTTSGGYGGAIYTLNDGNYSSLTIKKTKFIGNTSRIGACLANTSPYQNLIIDRCVFTNNTSQINIISLDTFYNTKIVNSYFIGNTVNDFNANLLYVNHYANDTTEDFEMVNCTIVNNYNIYTNTIQSEIIKLDKPYYKVRNCIIYGNTPYLGRQLTLGHTVENCLIENGYAGGTAIINSNPLFVNPNPTLNLNFDANAYDYNLANNSRCINVGNNSFVNGLYNLDLNNTNRIQGTTVDLGCYESNITLSTNNINEEINSLFYFDSLNNTVNFVTINKFYNKTLRVYDVSGRIVNSYLIDNSKMNLKLLSGIYFVKIENYKAIKIIVK
jgi:hypothetical protein